MIKVYHLKDKDFITSEKINEDYLDANTGFSEKQIPAVIKLFQKRNYDLVAEVKTASLEDAWEKTNHIHASWTDNKEVKAFSEEVRSSKVGDVFEDGDGHFYVVASIGFKQIEDGVLEVQSNKKSLKI